jgi:hypothetical protein
VGVNIVNIRFQLMPDVRFVGPAPRPMLSRFPRAHARHGRCWLRSGCGEVSRSCTSCMRQIGSKIRSFCRAREARVPDSRPGILFKFELSATHLGCTQCFSISHAVVPGGPAPGWADGRAGTGTGGGSNKNCWPSCGPEPGSRSSGDYSSLNYNLRALLGI